MSSVRGSALACFAFGGMAGAALGEAQGWILIQLCLLAWNAVLAAPASAKRSAIEFAVFVGGFHASAYGSFAFGVPQGLRLLVWIPVTGLIAANVACAWVLGYAAARLVPRPGPRTALVLPAVWVFQEWIFSCGELAFPWARLGTAQAPDGLFAGFLPWGGTLLASGLMMSFAALGILAWKNRALRRPAWALLICCCAFGRFSLDRSWTSAGTPLRADLVQSGVGASDKANAGNGPRILKLYLDAASAGDAQLLATSQTAIPKIPAALPPGYLDRMDRLLSARHADGVFGMYFDDPNREGFFNGVLALGASGLQRHLKYQLFPFGEFMPFSGSLRSLIQHALPVPQLDTLRPARMDGPLWIAGHRVAVAICYEAAFAQAWRQQAETADLLLNVSSDSSVPTLQLSRQFLQIDQARAIEFQKPLLRTSDVRGTYSIDPRGQLVEALPAQRAGVLRTTVIGRTGLTPYARFGDTLPLGICVMSIAAALLRRCITRRPRASFGPPRTPAHRMHAQSGQVLPLSLGLMLVGAGMFYLMVNAGQSVTEKIRVTNAADAAAYSAGLLEARALNYHAYLNRAMVANEIVIAQMVSYASWLEYFATASDHYEDAAEDVDFYILPNLKVGIIDAAFGGTEVVTHYFGTTAQEYVDYVVNYGIGPIITVNDAIVQLLSVSQLLVQGVMTAGYGQSQIAESVVRAMDPELKSEVVRLSLGYDSFVKTYAADDRNRFADVTMRSRDEFSRERNWTIEGEDIELVRKDGALKKRGGTDLVGYDEWRGIDTLELHGRSFGCGRFSLDWCDDVKEPVGWGALEVDAGGGDAGHGYHGNAYGDNPTTAQKADENMQTPAYYHFSGIPMSQEIRDLASDASGTTGVTVMVSKNQSATLTSGNAARAAAGGRLALFGDHPAKGVIVALSRATVYFDRVEKRADGKSEIDSLYNPYWRVHLSAPTLADRAYAATKQDGLLLPDIP